MHIWLRYFEHETHFSVDDKQRGTLGLSSSGSWSTSECCRNCSAVTASRQVMISARDNRRDTVANGGRHSDDGDLCESGGGGDDDRSHRRSFGELRVNDTDDRSASDGHRDSGDGNSANKQHRRGSETARRHLDHRSSIDAESGNWITGIDARHVGIESNNNFDGLHQIPQADAGAAGVDARRGASTSSRVSTRWERNTPRTNCSSHSFLESR